MARDLRLEVVLAAIDKVTAPLARIQSSSHSLGKAFKASRDKLKQLQDTQRDISSFRSTKAAVLEQSAALQSAQEKVKQLAAKIREAEVPTRALNQEFNRAVREARGLKTTHGEQQQALQLLRDKLNAAGVSTHNLTNDERRLRDSIASTTQAMGEQEDRLKRLATHQRQLASARQAYERTQATAGAMAAGGAAGLATGYALSRPLKSVVDAFAPSEDAATQLKVSMMSSDGSVPASFQKITELANNLGDRLPGTTADFQNMMATLKQQGLSDDNILGGTGEATAFLGVQLRMASTEAAEFAAKMQDATRTPEKDMMGLMDTIQRMSYLGLESGNMLAGFSKLSPALKLIRQNGVQAADSLGPLLVMMDQAGMTDGASAGNALRKVFQAGLDTKDMADANAMLKKDFKLGFQLDFTDGKGNFGGMENLFKQLEKLRPLNDEAFTAVVKKVFGEDAETLQVVQTMMDKGLTGYNEVAAKMKAQADLRRRVNEQLSTLSNTMEAAQGSWSNTLSEIGATIAPELKELINGFGNVAVKVKAWVQEHPVLTAAIVKTVGGLALLATAGGALLVMLASVLGPLAVVRHGLTVLGIKSLGAGTAIKGIGSAMLWFGKAVLWVGRALLMNPIGLAVTAIAGAAYLIYRNWDSIVPFFQGLWAEVKAGFNGGLGGIITTLANFSPIGLVYRAFAEVLNYLGLDLPVKFTEFGNMIVRGLVNGLMAGLGQIKGAITSIGSATIGWFKEKLGIHSPSRVFAELGGFTMAGLEQGLVGGQDGPLKALLDMSKRMTQASALALGVAAPVAMAAPASPIESLPMVSRPVVQDMPRFAEPQAQVVQDGPLKALLDMSKRMTQASALALGVAAPGTQNNPAKALLEASRPTTQSMPRLSTDKPLQIDRRPPLAATRPATKGQSNQVVHNYNITINGSGLNEAKLVDLIGQKIEQLKRADEARNRSRLSDSD